MAVHPRANGEGIASVPLSEDEQRILQEIEKSFYDSDPAFAKEVREKTLYRHAGRNIKWAGLGFVLGLVVVVLTFTGSLIAATLGFLVMLGCAYVIFENARKMGKAGLQSVSQKAGSFSEVLGTRSKKLKDRFRKEGD